MSELLSGLAIVGAVFVAPLILVLSLVVAVVSVRHRWSALYAAAAAIAVMLLFAFTVWVVGGFE